MDDTSRRDSVAIVGMGPGWYDAPFGSESHELWGMNNHHLRADLSRYHFDRWFELHDRTLQEARNPTHFDRLRKDFGMFGIRLYMQRAWSDIPGSKALPKGDIEAIDEDYGHYHAGTVDWMFCLALMEGFKRIELYGMNFQGGEPPSARACLEFWIGFAVARGVEVRVPETGDLLKILIMAKTDRQYAYDPIHNSTELPSV